LYQSVPEALMVNSNSDVLGTPVVPAHCRPTPPHWPVVHCAGLAPLQPVRPHRRPDPEMLNVTAAPGDIDQPPFEKRLAG
jgi:hypothetical protein